MEWKCPFFLSAMGWSGWCQDGQVHETQLGGVAPGQTLLQTQSIDDGTSNCPYSHTLVVGNDHHPHKVTAAMGKKKITQRSKIKSFVKVGNYKQLHAHKVLCGYPL